jgi:hypothetical protein
MSAAEMLSLRRFGDDQIVNLAKLAIENAFQPIAEIATAILPEGFVFSDAQAVSARIAEIKSPAKENDAGLVFDTFGGVAALIAGDDS